jgi:hypothetical protein
MESIQPFDTKRCDTIPNYVPVVRLSPKEPTNIVRIYPAIPIYQS